MSSSDEENTSIDTGIEPAVEPAVEDPARSLFEGWGLRIGRTAYGWAVARVELDRHKQMACVEFTREEHSLRVRFCRAREGESFARVGGIDMFYEKIEDESLEAQVNDVMSLLAEWFRQRGDHAALDALLASIESPAPAGTEEPEAAEPPSQSGVRPLVRNLPESALEDSEPKA